MESIEIVKDYVGGMNLYDVCAKYHIGKLKVKDILKSNGVELRKRGKQAFDKSGYVVSDFHIKKYKEEDGFYYVAMISFYPSLFKVFNHERTLDFVKCLFFIS